MDAIVLDVIMNILTNEYKHFSFDNLSEYIRVNSTSVIISKFKEYSTRKGWNDLSEILECNETKNNYNIINDFIERVYKEYSKLWDPESDDSSRLNNRGNLLQYFSLG